ncbi:MAG TPA: cytochrome c3 family protein, partial [Candidatus Eisenbacteria bacterium]|nr:cytochrome c3 family protein [Candidatus Eisenbacteria bacterium]
DNYALANPCQYCHVPARDGAGFLPIRFEAHCGACHLDGSDGTRLLPVATSEGQPGVQTLEAIKSGGEPGTYWAHLANPNEYFGLGPTLVRKVKVVHRDPWILENLRFLRKGLYADLGIAGILDTYGLASNESPAVLYGEVTNRLDQYASALNARGEQSVRQDLSVSFRNNLNRARKQIMDPAGFLPATPFLTPFQVARPGLAASRRQELLGVADSLTTACQLCHRIENAAITRVQKDQRALIRGRFDHRAHLLDMECLDCHSQIPQGLEDLAAYAESTKAANALPAERATLRVQKLAALRWREREAIQNLPGIKVCVDCHRPGKATQACVTCHDYHPGKPSTGLVTGL